MITTADQLTCVVALTNIVLNCLAFVLACLTTRIQMKTTLVLILMRHASLIRMKLAAILVICVCLLEPMMVRVLAHLIISNLPKPFSETIKTALKVHTAKMANLKITAKLMRVAYHVVKDGPARNMITL